MEDLQRLGVDMLLQAVEAAAPPLLDGLSYRVVEGDPDEPAEVDLAAQSAQPDILA